MSLTLSNAQKLSARIFSEINEKLDVVRGKGWDPFVIVTDLLEEAGEKMHGPAVSFIPTASPSLFKKCSRN